MERPIFYREKPCGPWELWVNREAMRLKEIEESARRLLAELKEEG